VRARCERNLVKRCRMAFGMGDLGSVMPIPSVRVRLGRPIGWVCKPEVTGSIPVRSIKSLQTGPFLLSRWARAWSSCSSTATAEAGETRLYPQTPASLTAGRPQTALTRSRSNYLYLQGFLQARYRTAARIPLRSRTRVESRRPDGIAIDASGVR
jgi:hypothetical protein